MKGGRGKLKKSMHQKRHRPSTVGEQLIMSDVLQTTDGKWAAWWSVGTRRGDGMFDSYDEADQFRKRNINREVGFT